MRANSGKGGGRFAPGRTIGGVVEGGTGLRRFRAGETVRLVVEGYCGPGQRHAVIRAGIDLDRGHAAPVILCAAVHQMADHLAAVIIGPGTRHGWNGQGTGSLILQRLCVPAVGITGMPLVGQLVVSACNCRQIDDCVATGVVDLGAIFVRGRVSAPIRPGDHRIVVVLDGEDVGLCGTVIRLDLHRNGVILLAGDQRHRGAQGVGALLCLSTVGADGSGGKTGRSRGRDSRGGQVVRGNSVSVCSGSGAVLCEAAQRYTGDIGEGQAGQVRIVGALDQVGVCHLGGNSILRLREGRWIKGK